MSARVRCRVNGAVLADSGNVANGVATAASTTPVTMTSTSFTLCVDITIVGPGTLVTYGRCTPYA
jgi:hypothetical protein